MQVKHLLRTLLNRMPLVGDVRHIRNELRILNGEVRALKSAAATALIDSRLQDHPRYSDPNRLLRYAAQVCSQNGEDGMIHEIFRRIQATDRIFVEVGVGYGAENNTAFLLSQGWRGFWVDGNAEFVGSIEKLGHFRDGRVRGEAAFVTKENIGPLFARLGVPSEFDLLSLDIDQNTFHAWEGLDGFRPRVVVIEYNASIPPDIDWKVNYVPDRRSDGSHNFGGSLKAFEVQGRKRGYSLVGCDFMGVNAFFVRDDLVGDHFSKPYTSENHYEPPRYSLIHRRGHANSILDVPVKTSDETEV